MASYKKIALTQASAVLPIQQLEENSARQSHGFNLLFFQRLLKIIHFLFAPRAHGKVIYYYIALILISVAKEVAVFHAGKVASDFFGVLLVQDKNELQHVTLRSLGILIAAAVGMTLVSFAGGLFECSVRLRLTHYLHSQVIRRGVYYPVMTDNAIDNTDQRITQDSEKFANTARSVFEKLVISPGLIIYYTVKTWEIAGYIGPVMSLAFFIFFAIVSRLVMSPAVHAVFMREREEGIFRFLHVRLRSFTESIAMLHGEKVEERAANKSLETLIHRQRKQVIWETPVSLVNQLSSYFGSILSYLIIAIPIYQGKYADLPLSDLTSLISLFSFESMYLIFQYTTIVEQTVLLADLAGYANRIGQLNETVKSLEHQEMVSGVDVVVPGKNNDNDSEGGIRFDHVSIVSPGGKTLLTDLNLQVDLGANLLVTGPNGSGKSSILRVFCGLWPTSTGSCTYFGNLSQDDVQLLPQVPYLTSGSLRHQIAYPSVPSSVSDAVLNELLDIVGLSELPTFLGGPDVDYGAEWERLLSPGEIQKLVFARLFYLQPKLAVLDEATSALDTEVESRIYNHCATLGITVISIGHRPTIERFHSAQLRLLGNGQFVYERIHDV